LHVDAFLLDASRIGEADPDAGIEERQGLNVTSVPVRPSAAPTTLSGSSATPSWKRMKCALRSRQIVRSSHSESALTTDTPTPCSPPETL
jgi:hypothetical protein